VPEPQPEPKPPPAAKTAGPSGKHSGEHLVPGPLPAQKPGSDAPRPSVPNNGPGRPAAHPGESSGDGPPEPEPVSALDDGAILAAKFHPVPGPPVPVAPPRAAAKPPAADWDAAEPAPLGRRVFAGVLDMVVMFALLVLGATASEMVLGKSSREVLVAASSAPKFPPVDLIIWLGGPALAGLLYAWLGIRGWTVGGWLKRRAAA
jgi:hypothetical protein